MTPAARVLESIADYPFHRPHVPTWWVLTALVVSYLLLALAHKMFLRYFDKAPFLNWIFLTTAMAVLIPGHFREIVIIFYLLIFGISACVSAEKRIGKLIATLKRS